MLFREDAFFDSWHKIKDLYGIKIPSFLPKDRPQFWEQEFGDIIIPYIIELNGNKYDFQSVSLFLEEGPYELNENVSVESGDIVIDCGANVGLFSAIASQKGADVYAFEPSSMVRERYLDLTAENNENIVVCPYALSDHAGRSYFSMDNALFSANKMNGSKKGFFETIDVTTLNQFVSDFGVRKVDFIKADIEGVEREMLKGAMKGTERPIIVHVSPWHLL